VIGMRLWRLPVLLVLVALITGLTAGAGPAQEVEIEYLGEEPELWEGPWTGMLFAGGFGTMSASGIDAVYELDLRGSFELEATDTAIAGTWNMGGDYFMDGTADEGSLHGEYESSGEGAVDGTPTEPRLVGTGTSTGWLTVTASGFERTITATPDVTDLAFDVVLDMALCNEVYGSFTTQLEARVAEEGWAPDMEGNFIAIQDEKVIQESLETWAKGFRATNEPDTTSTTDFPPGTPDIVKVFDGLLRRYNSWADAVRAPETHPIAEGQLWEETTALFSDLDDLTTRLRNLSECEQLMLGELGDKFGNVLTRAMFAVIDNASRRPDLTSHQLQALLHGALRAGALGGGSLFPAEAAAVDEALQS